MFNYNPYDCDKIIIMTYDECGDEEQVLEYRIPFAQGELTDEEFGDMCRVVRNRAINQTGNYNCWCESSYETRESHEKRMKMLREENGLDIDEEE